MPKQIALVRAINLKSYNRVAMADLRAMFEGLGFTDVVTLLQTGNVVFKSDEPAAKLETLLEKEAKKILGLDTDFMVRSAAQWRTIIARNPLTAEAKRDPARLVLMVCKEAPGSSLKVTGVTQEEVVHTRGREIYIWYPDGQGRSKLKLGARGTSRNWNTVLKLAALTSAR